MKAKIFRMCSMMHFRWSNFTFKCVGWSFSLQYGLCTCFSQLNLINRYSVNCVIGSIVFQILTAKDLNQFSFDNFLGNSTAENVATNLPWFLYTYVLSLSRLTKEYSLASLIVPIQINKQTLRIYLGFHYTFLVRMDAKGRHAME